MYIKVLYVFSDMECGVGGEGSGVCGAMRVRARNAQVGRFYLQFCRTKSLLRNRLVFTDHVRSSGRGVEEGYVLSRPCIGRIAYILSWSCLGEGVP